MDELPQERLSIAITAVSAAEAAFELDCILYKRKKSF